jgi:hypothetical protein
MFRAPSVSGIPREVKLVKALKEEGCKTLERVDESEYGKFAWVIDPEGNKIERGNLQARHNLYDEHTVVSLSDSRRTHLRSSSQGCHGLPGSPPSENR